MKTNNKSWRVTQQKFFGEKVEFVQDKRILDFFDQTPCLCIGDTDYFKKKLNVSKIKQKNQCLIICNKKISDKKLLQLLKKYKNFKKICISINKFYLYTNKNNKKIIDDYDYAIFNLIQLVFSKKKIKHFFVKNLNGHYFNFASPTTQFFLT